MHNALKQKNRKSIWILQIKVTTKLVVDLKPIDSKGVTAVRGSASNISF
jgi:hypothetical protein